MFSPLKQSVCCNSVTNRSNWFKREETENVWGTGRCRQLLKTTVLCRLCPFCFYKHMRQCSLWDTATSQQLQRIQKLLHFSANAVRTDDRVNPVTGPGERVPYKASWRSLPRTNNQNCGISADVTYQVQLVQVSLDTSEGLGHKKSEFQLRKSQEIFVISRLTLRHITPSIQYMPATPSSVEERPVNENDHSILPTAVL
jgi:hypothetical protein